MPYVIVYSSLYFYVKILLGCVIDIDFISILRRPVT